MEHKYRIRELCCLILEVFALNRRFLERSLHQLPWYGLGFPCRGRGTISHKATDGRVIRDTDACNRFSVKVIVTKGKVR
jgi:hypothetical protein